MEEEKKIFSKPAKSADFLLSKLRARGLKIDETEEVEIKYQIRSIGYFRLSGYFGPLQNPKDTFKEGTTFKDIIRLYEFDRQLRLITFEMITVIEVALRARITDIMSQAYESFWYTQDELFKEDTDEIDIYDYEKQEYKFITVTKFSSLKEGIKNSTRKVEDSEFMLAFYEKYHRDSPIPSWMVMESISFGKLSRLYFLLKSSQEKTTIANQFGAVNADYFNTWLHGLVVLRNACAHHGRVWNKKLIDIKIPTRPKRKFISCAERESLRKYYGISSCMLKMLNEIDTAFSKKFKEDLFKSIKSHDIDLKAMGFPHNWHDDHIWQ